jgi:Bacterial Ig-like domain (group 3)/FlgD Ig-like domain
MGIAARPLRRATSIAVGIALVIGVAAPPVLAIEPVATTIDMVWQGTPEGGVPFTATITLSLVEPPGPATDATGDVTVAEDATTLGTCPLADGTCDVTLTLATGDHTVTVSYPGDAGFAGATTDKLVSVVDNKVDATGVGLNYATFYPYKDGYKDKVTARGTRNEPASVTIKVYSPTGKLLKKVDLAKATGAYAWAWNGRNSSGTMYPVGKYRIEQKLTDEFQATQTWKNYVNLSAKRLYTYKKTLKQSLAQYDYGGNGWIGWKFTLPSATVYKKIVFGVDAKSGRPLGGFGPQDYTKCSAAYVGPGCVGAWKTIPTSRQWTNLSGSVAKHIKSGKARIFVWNGGGGVRPYYVRVVVTYAILK